MPASTSVKYFHSAMTGAPVLSGTAGSLIAVLDACLVNGFGSKTADSVTVASGIATFNVSAGIGAFEADAVILVAGATPSWLNGEKRIISATATAVTFDATGISDQTATGTITAKLAAAGWEKQFSGTNLVAYRSGDVTSTRAVLRVDDSGTTAARVVGYENMSAISTGNGPFPTALQQSGGLYWPKANAANATARGWTVIADNKTAYVHLHTVTSNIGVAGTLVAFGDFAGYKSGDAHAAMLAGIASDTSASTSGQTADMSHSSGTLFYMPRAYTALGSSLAGATAVESYAPSSGFSGAANASATPAYPNGADNALILSRKIIYETGSLRGVMRGIFFAVQNCQASFAWRDKIAGQGPYVGRKLMAIKGAGSAGTSSLGVTFFDVTGPWV